MNIISRHHDNIPSAESDDGLVTALATATTRLYGNDTLRCNTSGKLMWRGEYLNASGKVDGTKVPAHIWASAVDLMHGIDANNGAAEDAASKRAHEIQDSRVTATSERIAADMNRADSDL